MKSLEDIQEDITNYEFLISNKRKEVSILIDKVSKMRIEIDNYKKEIEILITKIEIRKRIFRDIEALDKEDVGN